MDEALRQAVREADRPEVREAVEKIYADLDAEIALRRPRCEASGRCCRFDEYGHRLYVTTIELAVFVQRYAARRPSPAAQSRGLQILSIPNDQTAGPCRFQADGRLCAVHEIRPFGCRIFFCDPDATDWQQGAYERYHAQLKRLHELHSIPYLYVEWRTAMAILLPANQAGHEAHL